ncbi:cyclin-A2-like [Myotis yumanensis]|uniref:cyclin-A2-like n=1 Tax=Myotis yumanensis TaxID=159337 RepID=UPI0038D1EC03
MDMSIVLEEEEPVSVTEVPDCHEDIHTYLREMEIKCKPEVGYMKKQPAINNSMRAILVDWLVKVGEEFRLQNETLHLAVNYIDRFLSYMSVLRGKLQLVGTAAMLLASKFEEIYPPKVAEFVYITDYTYTKKQVLRMEHLVLRVLSFDLAAATVNQFLTQYFLHQQPSNCKVESLAMFLGELSLVDADPYLKYLPSVIAGAAFHLALYTVTGQSWPESLAQKTGYTLESLKPCLLDLHQTYLRAPQHAQQSIREKYKHSKYHGVSLLIPPETLPCLTNPRDVSPGNRVLAGMYAFEQLQQTRPLAAIPTGVSGPLPEGSVDSVHMFGNPWTCWGWTPTFFLFSDVLLMAKPQPPLHLLQGGTFTCHALHQWPSVHSTGPLATHEALVVDCSASPLPVRELLLATHQEELLRCDHSLTLAISCQEENLTNSRTQDTSGIGQGQEYKPTLFSSE